MYSKKSFTGGKQKTIHFYRYVHMQLMHKRRSARIPNQTINCYYLFGRGPFMQKQTTKQTIEMYV